MKAQPKAKLGKRIAEAKLSTTHALTANRLHCRLGRATRSDALAGVHDTHCCEFQRGLVMCAVCGLWSYQRGLPATVPGRPAESSEVGAGATTSAIEAVADRG